MPQNRRYRITLKMLESGEKRLSECRAEPGHTPQTVCHAVFVAMLDAADVHPGYNLASAFEWSMHDLPSRRPPSAKRPKGQKLTRADFDHEGKRLAGIINGRPHYQWINNFWYLKEYHIKR